MCFSETRAQPITQSIQKLLYFTSSCDPKLSINDLNFQDCDLKLIDYLTNLILINDKKNIKY